jgi:hypothetical protein
MGRFGFIPYVNERLTGLEPRPNPGGESTWARSREHLAFPEYYAWAAQMPGAAGGAEPTRWVCTAPIAYLAARACARPLTAPSTMTLPEQPNRARCAINCRLRRSLMERARSRSSAGYSCVVKCEEGKAKKIPALLA